MDETKHKLQKEVLKTIAKWGQRSGKAGGDGGGSSYLSADVTENASNINWNSKTNNLRMIQRTGFLKYEFSYQNWDLKTWIYFLKPWFEISLKRYSFRTFKKVLLNAILSLLLAQPSTRLSYFQDCEKSVDS